jgi:hypothetical protein
MTDVAAKVEPTEAQRAERDKLQAGKQNRNTMTKEKEHEIKGKHRPKSLCI